MNSPKPSHLRENDTAILVDISSAANSVQAIQMLEDFIRRWGGRPVNPQLNLNVGDIILTSNILNKMKQLSRKWGFELEAIYAKMPQTQQSALDEGFFVRETPKGPAFDPKLFMENFLLSHETEEKESKGDGIHLPFIKSDQSAESTSPLRPEKHTPERLSYDNELSETPSKSDLVEHTLYIKQTVRSGRVIHFDGNIVIIGDVHTGSEIKATGDIAVWGELRGIAHAGAGGDSRSEIRALKIDALQLRIADYIARRPDRIYYHKEASSTATMAAELAKVSDGEIRIFKEVIG